jgi:hypothetical protein
MLWELEFGELITSRPQSTLRRHRYGSVEEVEASLEPFCRYYNHRRPHPRLRAAHPWNSLPGRASRGAPRELPLASPRLLRRGPPGSEGSPTRPLGRRTTDLSAADGRGRSDRGGRGSLLRSGLHRGTVRGGHRAHLAPPAGGRLDGEVTVTHPFPIGRRSSLPTTPWLAEGLSDVLRYGPSRIPQRCREACPLPICANPAPSGPPPSSSRRRQIRPVAVVRRRVSRCAPRRAGRSPRAAH